MRSANTLATFALGIALFMSLVLGRSATAQETDAVELQLTPSRDSGVSGTAILTQVEGGVQVELNMRGLPKAGVKHINHIHGGGTCADDRAGRTAPVTIPLEPVVANDDGTGSATTTIRDVTLAKLFDGSKERFILVHAEAKGEGIPPGIACADFIEPAGTGAPAELPESGGIHPTVLTSAAVSLLLGISIGLFLLRRRNT